MGLGIRVHIRRFQLPREKGGESDGALHRGLGAAGPSCPSPPLMGISDRPGQTSSLTSGDCDQPATAQPEASQAAPRDLAPEAQEGCERQTARQGGHLGLSAGSLSQGVPGAVHFKAPRRPEHVLRAQSWGRKGAGVWGLQASGPLAGPGSSPGKTTAHPRRREDTEHRAEADRDGRRAAQERRPRGSGSSRPLQED